MIRNPPAKNNKVNTSYVFIIACPSFCSLNIWLVGFYITLYVVRNLSTTLNIQEEFNKNRIDYLLNSCFKEMNIIKGDNIYSKC